MIQDRFFQESGNGTVRFVSKGYGEHAVLLLPGALDTLEQAFAPQMHDLDDKIFTIVGWDPPGYGNKGGFERIWDTDMFERDADMAIRLMKELNWNRFSVIGWSDGAMTAFIMAAKYPESIQGLVAIGGNSFVDAADIKIYEGSRNVYNWEPSSRDPSFETYGGARFSELWNYWCDVMKKFYEVRNGDICKSVLKEVLAPTLVIHGRHDPSVPVHHAFYIAEHIRNSSLYLDGTSFHAPHLTNPRWYSFLMTNFLQQNVQP